LERDLYAVFGDIKYTDLKLPLSIAVIDLSLNQEVLIEDENLIEGLKAGIAFPGLFPPVALPSLGRALGDSESATRC
jgi:predicted acylesterase/phospholipase RssA